MESAVYWAQRLVRCPSVTPDEAGCYRIVRAALDGMGFSFTEFEHQSVRSLWAKRGSGAVQLCFSAHVDVVPIGDRGAWSFDPFAGDIVNGLLRGRGSVDMKGALGAMLAALRATANTDLTIGLLLSASEEGNSELGTGYALQQLQAQGESIAMALVGEPTSVKQLGDYYKIGRRGSLSLDLTVRGRQGHVAYPEQAVNPVHQSLELLQQLRAQSWGEADADFAAGSLQIVSSACANTTFNIIPNSVRWLLNWRYPATTSAKSIINQVEQLIEQQQLDCDLNWLESAQAFVTQPGTLSTLLAGAISTVCHQPAAPSCSGGTSDARFFAAADIEVLEFGARNTGAHQVDESASVADLELLSSIYQLLIRDLCTEPSTIETLIRAGD